MKIKRRNTDPKIVFTLAILATLIGWIGTAGGKYDHVRLSLGGYQKQQFTVGDNNEQIDVRLNIAGQNWDLDFDEEEGILIRQDDETILEGWFISSDEFALWESDLLNMTGFTIISDHLANESGQYFCSSSKGQYIFLTKIEDSEYGTIFFTPDDAEIPQKRCSEAFERLTITVSTPYPKNST